MSRHDKGRREVAPPWRRIASTRLKGHLMSSKDHPQSPALPPFSEQQPESIKTFITCSSSRKAEVSKEYCFGKFMESATLKKKNPLIGEKQSLRAHLRWFLFSEKKQ